jgi:hypothetical protein
MTRIKKLILDIYTSEKYFLITVFSVSLLIRLAYVIPLSLQKLSPDAFDWMRIGYDVATGVGYQDTWRPPGYSTYLGMIFFVFGKSILAARIVNSIVSSLTCVVIYFIGKKLFYTNVGKISAILLMYYPYSIAYSGDLISETFLTFVISLAILSLIILSEQPSFKNTVIAGFAFAIASLTKATIMPFLALSALWLAWKTRSLKYMVLLGIFTIVFIVPWSMRNYFHYHASVVPISPMWRSFGGSNCDEAMTLEKTELDTPMPYEMSLKAIPKGYEDVMKLPRMEQEKVFKEKAIKWISENPDKFVWLLERRLLHFWRLYPVMAYKWQKLMAKMTSGIYIPLCFLGIVLSLKKHALNAALLITLFISFTAVYICFAITLRYRVPIDPYIIIFASFALMSIYNKFKKEA